MESKLKLLFEYQRFEQNASLAKVIEEAERSCHTRLLTEEELDMVAGGVSPQNNNSAFNPDITTSIGISQVPQ